MCSKHCSALARDDAEALLCARLSGGAEMATAEAHWSSWGATERAREKTWLMDIFKLYLGEGTYGCLGEC